jgi:hypothetical protein
MKETVPPEAGRSQRSELDADDWELIVDSVLHHLRAYTEADAVWWEPDDDRPQRLETLLLKIPPTGLSTAPAENSHPPR